MVYADRPAWQRYGAAIVFVAAALSIKLLLVPIVSQDVPVLLFFAPVMLSAAFGGMGPGIVASILAALCDEYFFMAPFWQWHLYTRGEVVRLLAFFFEALFIGFICARMRHAVKFASAAHLRAEANATESRELQRRILEISDAEQQRIGHDLHDGLGQHLTGIALLARRFEERLTTAAPSELAEAHSLTALAQSAVEWTHDLCSTLAPSTRDFDDLPDLLQELAAHTENILRIHCGFELVGNVNPAYRPVGLQLYRIAQEAVSNAVRHGKAKHVILRLNYMESGFVMEIIDDGSGIDPAARSADGMGLKIMRYRAMMIGATMEIENQKPGGARIICRSTAPANTNDKERYVSR